MGEGLGVRVFSSTRQPQYGTPPSNRKARQTNSVVYSTLEALCLPLLVELPASGFCLSGLHSHPLARSLSRGVRPMRSHRSIFLVIGTVAANLLFLLLSPPTIVPPRVSEQMDK